MASTINIDFNFSGNYSSALQGMFDGTGKLIGKIEEAQNAWRGFSDVMVLLNNTTDVISKVADGFNALTEPGKKFDTMMHELEAVAGVMGDKLKEIEGYARQSAKAFGTDAAEAVKAYQNLLGQLSPELAEYPEALKAMGDSVQTVSKLMGNDAVVAADVLTTAMNQYGVDLSDPIEASRKMAEMMNVMAKAGQEGSAELPAIKQALQNAGMAAKGANVSFEETNAAIQVLDKAGKKGAEGGVALRNVLAQIGQGRFTPKQAAEAMAQAGVDVVKLADKSLTLKDRLDMLKPLLSDTALLSEFFGKENANAAMALINNTDELGRLTEAVTGSQSAVEQADIVMQSYEERHFNELPYLHHSVYLFLTKSNKKRMAQQSNFSALCLGHLVPKEIEDKEAVIKFMEAVDQFERIINDTMLIRLERITEEELVGTEDKPGLLDRYFSLSEEGHASLEDIRLEADLVRVGDNKLCLHTLSDTDDCLQASAPIAVTSDSRPTAATAACPLLRLWA